MSKPVRIHNARFGRFEVQCPCGKMLVYMLIRGYNRRSSVCVYCKAVIRAEMAYDGYGVAVLKKLTVEELEGEQPSESRKERLWR
jgi:hypothetical protein